MVVTRQSTKTTKEQLFGPLPPPTRRRPGPSILDRRRKLQLRQLSKLPPLPHHLRRHRPIDQIISSIQIPFLTTSIKNSVGSI
ncbi:hypothetical protein KEM48_011765 [Puccinia striiformis f. sp. tritici PST-130]|nr:hypothetical protein KEM48_011765 [Puccinia striiformis f. sp. tritici PST-130]